jgi:hypothetical protein
MTKKTIFTIDPRIENFEVEVKEEENNQSIETNKIFCFNGMFTILTVGILILLLIFIGRNQKKSYIIKNKNFGF